MSGLIKQFQASPAGQASRGRQAKALEKRGGKHFQGSEKFTGIDPYGDEEEKKRRRARRGPVSQSGLLAGVRSPLSV